MKTTLMQAVPDGADKGGWWQKPARQGAGGKGSIKLAVLVLLIALGDAFVWQVIPGLSLAVFCAALVLAGLALAWPGLSRQRASIALGMLLLSILPLVELVQPLSVILAACGVTATLVFIAGLNPESLLRAGFRLWPLGVAQTVGDAGEAIGVIQAGTGPGQLRKLAMAWLLPLGVGFLFLMLLSAANPVLDQWLWRVTFLPMRDLNAERFFFWLFLIPLCWTALSLSPLSKHLPQPLLSIPRKIGPRREGLLNPASVTRALVVFNLVFAVQTLLDIVYLYGGAELPYHVTYAEYAHRGAYPLLVTALLAGAFTLGARRWIGDAPLLRAGLMLFVAQNLALTVGSAVRLDMYVDAYGLTRLRVSAAVWMGLVALGLLLTLWSIWQDRGNRWLLLRCGALGVATLWGMCFVNVDWLIANHNLRSLPHYKTDHYVCRLSEAAKPAIVKYNAACRSGGPRVSVPGDWREWGFRNARTRSSLAQITAGGTP